MKFRIKPLEDKIIKATYIEIGGKNDDKFVLNIVKKASNGYESLHSGRTKFNCITCDYYTFNYLKNMNLRNQNENRIKFEFEGKKYKIIFNRINPDLQNNYLIEHTIE